MQTCDTRSSLRVLPQLAMGNCNQVFHACLVFLCLYSKAPETYANSSSQIWCPEGYRALQMKGFLFHVCLPMSCTDTPMTMLDNNDAYGSHCLPFTEHFRTCPKVFLGNDQYTKSSNNTIYNTLDRSYVQQGEYFFHLNKVAVCAGAQPSQKAEIKALHAAATPRPCMPFAVIEGVYAWQSNTTVFISSVRDIVTKGYYQVDSNGSVTKACYQKDFPILDCKIRTRIGSNQMAILPTMELNTSFVKGILYALGDYALAEDKEFAVVCVRNSTPEYQGDFTVTMYGVAALISAVCLLLALLAHLFLPRLNYHTKALLCLAFSLLVMYTVICIRNFGSRQDFTWAGNMVIFALQYIFVLSSFFWLNVVAFDLWRTFSGQNVATHLIKSKQEAKRWFVVKCVYAFGVPVLMCTAAIGISLSRTVQEKLHIYLDFNNNNWIHGDVGMLTLFCGPVMVILVSNAIFFGLTVKNIAKVRRGSVVLRSHCKNIKIFKVYIKLFIIMGLSWFSEIIYWFAKDMTHETVWYVSDLFNNLQGVLVFIFYVCKKKTLQRIKDKFKHNVKKTAPLSQESKLTGISCHRSGSKGISIVSLTPIPENVQV